MHLYTCREKACASERVSYQRMWPCNLCLQSNRAKYIEGLENRLGRMEALLKLSGLLSDEDVDRTDLSMLEKRLADKATARSRATTPSDTPRSHSNSQPPVASGSFLPPQPATTLPTPQSTAGSPKPTGENEKEEEVEALSDMMCSLVTNNCGETRYIGIGSLMFFACALADYSRLVIRVLDLLPQRNTVDK